MLHKLRNRAADQKGFTLIELLVVILIIGILAAIAIPSFLNQRDKANDSEAKSGARSAQTAMETFLTDSSNQSYAGADPTALIAIEQSLAQFNPAGGTQRFTVPSASATGYAVTVASAPTGNTFTITRTGGNVARTCTVLDTAKKGGCRVTSGTSGTW